MDLNLRRARGKGGKVPLSLPEASREDQRAEQLQLGDEAQPGGEVLAIEAQPHTDDVLGAGVVFAGQDEEDPTMGAQPQLDDDLDTRATLVVGSEGVAGLGNARELGSQEFPVPVASELAVVGSGSAQEHDSRGLLEATSSQERQPDRTSGWNAERGADDGIVTPDFLTLVATTQGAREGWRNEAPPNPFWDQAVQDEFTLQRLRATSAPRMFNTNIF